MAQIACCCNGAEAFSLWCAEDAVDNLSLDQVAEEWNILGSLKQVDQPSACVQKADGSLTHGYPTRKNRCFGIWQLFPADDLPYRRHVKLKKHGEQRDLF